MDKLNDLDEIKEPEQPEEPTPKTEVEEPEVQGEEPEVQGEEPEVQGEEPEVQGEESEVQGEESEVQGEEPEVQGEESEVQGEESEVQGEEPEVQGEEPEVQGEESEVHGEEPEVQGEEPEVQGEESEVHGEEPIQVEPVQLVKVEQKLQSAQPNEIVPQEEAAPPVEKAPPKKSINKKTAKSMFIVGDTLMILVVYCVSLVCFLFGAVTYDGDSLQMISAITLIINITNIISLFWYSVLAGVAISVIYIITFIMAITKLITLIKYAPKALSSVSNEQTRINALIVSRRTAIQFFLNVLTLQAIANILSNNTFSWSFILLIAVCGALYVAMDAFDYLINEKQFDLKYFIIMIIKSAVLVSAVLISFNIVNKDMLDGFIFGMKMLFSGSLFESANAAFGVYNFYYYILSYAMFVAVEIMIAVQCHHVFTRHNYYYPQYSAGLSQAAIGQVIYLAVAALIDLSILIMYNYTFVMSEYLTIYFRVICLLVACAIAYLPHEKKAAKKENDSAAAQTEKAA